MGPLHILFADSNQHDVSVLDFARRCQLLSGKAKASTQTTLRGLVESSQAPIFTQSCGELQTISLFHCPSKCHISMTETKIEMLSAKAAPIKVAQSHTRQRLGLHLLRSEKSDPRNHTK
jgi:hypothetical protein